jgi:hypothetical protein
MKTIAVQVLIRFNSLGPEVRTDFLTPLKTWRLEALMEMADKLKELGLLQAPTRRSVLEFKPSLGTDDRYREEITCEVCEPGDPDGPNWSKFPENQDVDSSWDAYLFKHLDTAARI